MRERERGRESRKDKNFKKKNAKGENFIGRSAYASLIERKKDRDFDREKEEK